MDQMQSDAGRSAGLPPDINPVSEVLNPAMRAATTYNRNLLASVAAYQNEWLGFLSVRGRENLDFHLRLAHCRTLPELQQTYVDYWKRASEQYGVEFQHLSEIAQPKPQPAPETAAAANRVEARPAQPRPYEYQRAG